MSTVRYHDGIPHIVRYGMHDEKHEKCWAKFWRNGVRFQVNVDKIDVEGTEFYKQWRPLLRETIEPGESIRQFLVNQWQPLCDLLMTTSMPMLERLAPRRQYWTTLADYLHTPAYSLWLVKVDGEDRVEARVVKGPDDTAAYELCPVAFDRIPQDLQRYNSNELEVLQHEVDWRQKPAKLRSRDGQVFYFKPCEVPTKNGLSGEVINRSLDAIYERLQLHKYCVKEEVTFPDCTPKIRGIVIDVPPQGNDETLVAGLLLTWIPKGRTLFELCRDATDADKARLLSESDDLKQQVLAQIQDLHSKGIVCGRSDHSLVNQHSVLIDGTQKTWLICTMMVSPKDTLEEGKQRDLDAVDRLFKTWLPQQLKPKQST